MGQQAQVALSAGPSMHARGMTTRIADTRAADPTTQAERSRHSALADANTNNCQT